ncbi:hypothetical protein [Leeuwenhoekiella sp. H156]|uniref:hypothetical protein n=1 Tax=Leeuwenhoekiella sp. H156 TaxID=3450128 RepID=UPI003FA40D75
MKKSITLLGALFVTCLMQAETNPVSENQKKPAPKTISTLKPIETPQVVVELPEAVLRLHDLEKSEYKGETIYKHIPLELAKIKSPVKTV